MENKSHLSQSAKTRTTKDTYGSKLAISSQDTKSMHSSQLTKSSKGTNASKSTLDTMPSTVSSTLVVTSEDLDSYWEIIPKAIHKTVVHINKTTEKVDKTKSLEGIIKNILKNMSQSKKFPRILSDVIQKDGNWGVRVMNMMVKLGIIVIAPDNKHLTLIQHKLEDFEDQNYDEKWYKEKVREEMLKANNQ